ncbi:MAG: cytidylate kinase family protein [Bacillota bacterium]|nr:cytidylate kinase family protein [Bacillota bacterium]
MPVITISRQFGAGGEIVAELTAKRLGMRLIDRNAITDALKDMGLSPQLMRFDEQVLKGEDAERRMRFYLTALHEYLTSLAQKESFVLVGRGGQFLFRDKADAFHILVCASFGQRVQWIREIHDLERKPASLLVREHDRRKKRYIRQVFDRSWLDPEQYDLVVNTRKLTPQGAADLAGQAAQAFLQNRPDDHVPADTRNGRSDTDPGRRPVSFMHPSEEEFARLLDFYNIPWEYEPRTFPLQWDSEGNVTEAFSPDFYLPDQNLYVELTTQRQKLVWKKNKKARRLKELYPDVDVRIIYNKDYHHILESFGINQK